MSIEELQTSLENLIQQDFSFIALEKLLSPIPLYANNSIFKTYVNQIVAILTKDRDGDKKFTTNDLLLFSKDIIGMTALITSLLLILNSIPNIKINYTEGETEQIIFKLIVYIFLVVIPANTQIVFTVEQKHELLNICMMIYMLLIQSGMLKKLVVKVAQWFKTQWKNCFDNESVIDQKLPKLKDTIRQSINNY